jgi:chromosome segregation ATPase
VQKQKAQVQLVQHQQQKQQQQTTSTTTSTTARVKPVQKPVQKQQVQAQTVQGAIKAARWDIDKVAAEKQREAAEHRNAAQDFQWKRSFIEKICEFFAKMFKNISRYCIGNQNQNNHHQR